ncbi:26S proteosome subunit alpha-4 [Spraguea lophii 42_110]|uniref:26S proteosome subunit alpha-4 n=1 Tax=Spraguea lophii (strain 42_110) TaxID=1358809 RepID=S7W9R9_SPRLO|nr:26S proteosome subunit alpha-4 [Spraguea lophii 42_110]
MVYDRSLALFSPDGRLIQVEYAQKSCEQGSSVIYNINTNIIRVCMESRNQNLLLIEDKNKRLACLDPDLNFYASYSGISSDSDHIIRLGRIIIRNYKLQCGEDILLDQLAEMLSDSIQKNTISRGNRPFGAKIVLFGFQEGVARIYVLEPDGNYIEYERGAIGQKSDDVLEAIEKKDNGVYVCLEVMKEVVQNDSNRIIMAEIGQHGVRWLDVEEI